MNKMKAAGATYCENDTSGYIYCSSTENGVHTIGLLSCGVGPTAACTFLGSGACEVYSSGAARCIE